LAITTSQIKELREKTGVGIMDCKTALNESGGDIEAESHHKARSSLISMPEARSGSLWKSIVKPTFQAKQKILWLS